eukprot:6859858-Prymnesium_polylepis.1
MACYGIFSCDRNDLRSVGGSAVALFEASSRQSPIVGGAAAASRRGLKLANFRAYHLGYHTNCHVPQVTVTSGITAAARARGDLFTVMPEVGLTPYRARATDYITRGTG